jgi:BlaI family penicillinase repressor
MCISQREVSIILSSLKLCDSDYRFMTIVWDHAPIGSGKLVELCAKELGWKKSTTYTVIKKLSERGFIKNENAVVEVLVPKESVQAEETDYFVERTFNGSLPKFLAAFLDGRKITKREADEIMQLIEKHRED